MNVFTKRRFARLVVCTVVALWVAAYAFAAIGSPNISHGPSFPPDPWDGKVAHGPSFPPDPWDGKLLRTVPAFRPIRGTAK